MTKKDILVDYYINQIVELKKEMERLEIENCTMRDALVQYNVPGWND